MANKFKDFGVTPIHLDNKYFVKELDDIFEEINDIFYEFSFLYVNDTARLWMMGKIADAGKRIKEINCPTKGTGNKSKKEELLTKLREIYKKLDVHIQYESSFDVLENKMCNYQVSRYLKEKEEGMTVKQQLFWLNKINLFKQAYKINEKLVSVNNEIINCFKI